MCGKLLSNEKNQKLVEIVNLLNIMTSDDKNKSNLVQDNYWAAGLVEAKGEFHVNGIMTKLKLSLEIPHKERELLDKLVESFGGKVIFQESSKKYVYISCEKDLQRWANYFQAHPLKSYKSHQWQTFKKLVNYKLSNYHTSKDYKKKEKVSNAVKSLRKKNK